jgi:NarL family two-component system response regulator YdfI
MIRVVIVAARVAIREGLSTLLADAKDIEIVGHAARWADLADALPSMRPDVVLLDVSAAHSDIRPIASESAKANAALVVIEATGDLFGAAGLVHMHGLRGFGCLARDADGSQIAATVRAVASGLVVVDHALLGSGLAFLPAPYTSEPEDQLTARELEVLQLMALGLPNKVIAARLGISLHTVKFHVASILSKLRAESRTEAVRLGARGGLISL